MNPLNDGVIADLEATRSFLLYLREEVDPEKKEVYCVVGIPAVADGDAKNLQV